MPPTNDFVPFCPTDTGTNLLEQAPYLADPQLAIGNQPGIARLQLVNKALRQATYIASCVAQFLANATGSNVLDDANQAEVLATMAKVWPTATGVILPFAGSSAPTGFLLADGTSYLRATYAALFAVIGTTWGSADGTHFNVPNASGMFLRGAGTQTIGGVTYTTTLGTVQSDEMQGHFHSLSTSSGLVRFGFANTYNIVSGSNGDTVNPAVGSPTTDGSNGSPRTGAETRPANIGINYIIKT